jgi:hypothetical protein
MKTGWFQEWGWVYRPLSWQGWCAVVLTAAFCIQVFVAVDRHSHSVNDTMYRVFPYCRPSLCSTG